MGIKRYIKFNDVHSEDYGIYAFPVDADATASRSYTSVQVQGRIGDLLISNKRYLNQNVNYVCIAPYDGLEEKDRFMQGIISSEGYKRLYDTSHADYYRMAKFVGGNNTTVTPYGDKAKFVVNFDCKPQKYLITGDIEQEFTADGKINNPTKFDSQPVIRVYGSGTVQIGNNAFTVAGHQQNYVDIDSEMMDCYSQGENMNKYVFFGEDGFPVLHEGMNGIKLGSGITKVVIIPRWWRL